MAFTTFGTVFVDNVTPVPAAFLNKLRTEQADALDAIGGGTYVNTAPIIFSAGSAGWAFGGPVSLGAAVTATGTLTVTGATSLADVTQFTRTGRARRRPRVILSDADHTIDTTQGDCFQLSGNPGLQRIITLRTSTAPLPAANELIELIVPTSGIFTGAMYLIKREDATVVASFFSAPPTAASITAQFEFDAGVWRLGLNSGRALDGGAVVFGVVPGAGA